MSQQISNWVYYGTFVSGLDQPVAIYRISDIKAEMWHRDWIDLDKIEPSRNKKDVLNDERNRVIDKELAEKFTAQWEQAAKKEGLD